MGYKKNSRLISQTDFLSTIKKHNDLLFIDDNQEICNDGCWI